MVEAHNLKLILPRLPHLLSRQNMFIKEEQDQ